MDYWPKLRHALGPISVLGKAKTIGAAGKPVKAGKALQMNHDI